MKAATKQPVAFVKGRIAPSQIKAIHAVINKLGIDDDTYRHILSERYKAKSCKDLSWKQAEELLESLNGGKAGMGESGKPHHRITASPHPLKYTDMNSRPGFASGAQLRLVDAMWDQVTRTEDEAAKEKALDSFSCRILGVAGLRMVKSWQVEKLVKALEAMGAVKKQ